MKTKHIVLLVLVALLVVGGVLVANFLSFRMLDGLLTTQVQEQQLTETQHAATQIEFHIEQVQNELIALSKLPDVEGISRARCGRAQEVHEEGFLDDILEVDSRGLVTGCSDPTYADYLGLNVMNKDYFTSPRASQEPFVTGQRQGSAWQVLVSVPLFETTSYTPYPNFVGDFKGVLLSIVELQDLFHLYLDGVIDPEVNEYLIVNEQTNETLMSSSFLVFEESNLVSLPRRRGDWTEIVDVTDVGESIVASSDIILGTEEWRIYTITPMDWVASLTGGARFRQVVSLIFVLLAILGISLYLISLFRSREVVEQKLKKANVTLEQLGINVATESSTFTPVDTVLDSGKLYLVREDNEDHGYDLFVSTLNRDYAGLGLVRENPEAIKRKYGLSKTSFIWLRSGEGSQTNVDTLLPLVKEFFEKSPKSALFIDRLDYLIAQNGFEKTQRFVHSLNDLARGQESLAIIAANPDLIEDAQLKAISVETVDLFGRDLQKRVELSEVELEILRLVNERNVANKLMSYKDITKHFNITKPTTRSKIKHLVGLCLVDVEQKGRMKVLRVTSAGRRLL